MALGEHTFFNPEHLIQFNEATAISNNRGFSQWVREAIEIKKHMFAYLSAERDARNINISLIYDFHLKKEPMVKKEIQIFHNYQGTRLLTGPKELLQY